jgi:hypothetical protein
MDELPPCSVEDQNAPRDRASLARAVTTRIGNAVLIESEPDTTCARCKQAKECRDALGNGTRICFSCTTAREKDAYMRRLFGDPPLS